MTDGAKRRLVGFVCHAFAVVALVSFVPIVVPAHAAASSSTTVTLTVPSTVQWVNTGLTVQAGDHMQVSASGSWSPSPQVGSFGPDGAPQGNADNFLNLQDIGVCAVCAATPAPHWAALIGYIGDNPPGPASYTSLSVLPDAQRVFFVGSAYNAGAPFSGPCGSISTTMRTAATR